MESRETEKSNDSTPGAGPHPRRTRNWDGVAAITAALIGLLALCVSGYTAYIQRQQVRAQVWPYLIAGNDDNGQSLIVQNKGVGPAVVRSAQIWVDGKPQTDWEHVLDALGMSKPRPYSQSTINPDVLSPGEELQMIRFPDKGNYQRFRAAAVGHMAISLCYCSSLDECWTYRDNQLVGYKGPVLHVKAVEQCPRLPLADVFVN